MMIRATSPLTHHLRCISFPFAACGSLCDTPNITRPPGTGPESGRLPGPKRLRGYARNVAEHAAQIVFSHAEGFRDLPAGKRPRMVLVQIGRGTLDERAGLLRQCIGTEQRAPSSVNSLLLKLTLLAWAAPVYILAVKKPIVRLARSLIKFARQSGLLDCSMIYPMVGLIKKCRICCMPQPAC